MAENRRGKDKRYYFNRVQMVLLAAGFTIASAVIFILGMVVGKGIEERKIIKAEEPLIKLPVKPGQQSGGSAADSDAKDELTFYDTLTKPPAAPVDEEKKAAKPQEKAVKNDLKEPARKLADPQSQATRVGAQPRVDKAAEKAALRKTPERAKPAEKVALARAAEKEKSPEPSPRHPTGAAENTNEAGKWTVQVNAFPDEKSAQGWVDRLKSKGYNAYVTEIRSNGRTWYRVRVGRYGSREEADRVAEALKSKENLPKAFSTERKADG
jgi:cell division septation protein DedD